VNEELGEMWAPGNMACFMAFCRNYSEGTAEND
jgi:hypothetical protein